MSRIRKTQAHDPGALPVRDRYGLLVGTVAPRPIALASTVDAEGRRKMPQDAARCRSEDVARYCKCRCRDAARCCISPIVKMQQDAASCIVKM